MITRPWFDNPELGVKRLWHFDPATGDIHIETRFNTDGLFEENNASLNNVTSSSPYYGDGKIVARIPLPIFYGLQAAGVKLDDPDDPQQTKIKAFLNDPSFSKFRTFPGRI